MPKPIYTFMTRGNQIGGHNRFENREDAQRLYDELHAGLQSGKEFIELTLNEDKFTVRAKDISSFGISVTLEETPEERKARAILEIERYGYANQPCESSGYAKQGLIGGGGLI